MKTSYLEYYCSEIAPVFREIDLALKTSEGKFTVDEAADILMISPREVENIMKAERMVHIDKKNLVKIMEEGSSEVCRLFAREKSTGSPYVYTREDIAFIYGLDIAAVNSACDSVGIKEATAYTLQEILSIVDKC